MGREDQEKKKRKKPGVSGCFFPDYMECSRIGSSLSIALLCSSRLILSVDTLNSPVGSAYTSFLASCARCVGGTEQNSELEGGECGFDVILLLPSSSPSQGVPD